MSEKTMETVPTCNVGRINLSSESISVSATRELVPMPLVRHSGDVSCTETTSTMVIRSQVWGGRSSAAIPEVETRPDVEYWQETEIENPAEVVITVRPYAADEKDLGTARPRTAEKLGKWKKSSERRKHCVLAVVARAESNIFAPPQTPSRGRRTAEI